MRKLATVIGLIMALGLLNVPAASAHDAATYYPKRWVTSQTQNWSFTGTFPGGDWRTRVRDGLAQWNSLNQPMRFTEVSQRSDFDPYVCPSTYGTNGVHWRKYDGSIAFVNQCSNSREMVSTNLVFNSSEDWYTGTGDAPGGFLGFCSIGTCQTDAWSVSSHEWGHMTSFGGSIDGGHFSRSESICADNGGQHTMCPLVRDGTERMRTLETHDRETFDGAY